MLTRLGLVLVAFCLLPYVIVAQSSGSDEKERVQKRAALIDQIVSDIPNLKLAENRAIAYARAGSALWSLDQKRALSLYQNAITELINAQMLAASAKKNDSGQNDLLNGGTTRQQILNTIASHDAALALEYLFKTRTAAIAKVMAASPENKKISGSSNNNYLAQNEFNMEQSFVRMAADQNPLRAKKLIEDAIAKGISNETLALLKKLAEKEPDDAAGLASQVVDKLMRSELTVNGQPNYPVSQLMTSLLNDFLSSEKSGERTLKLDESQMRSMAQKLISYSLEHVSYDGGYLIYSLTPIAQRFAPSVVGPLKAAAMTASCRGLCGWDPEMQALMSNAETTPEQLIALVNKVPEYQRNSIYQSAANKYVQQGNMSKAREIISENFADDAVDEMMQNVDSQYAYKLINEGNFANAEQVIDTFAESMRIGALINLANTAYSRDNEKNRPYALALIAKVRDIIGGPPEDNTEFQYLMQVVSSLMNIDPPEAFRIYESLVPQMNDLSDAAALLNGFQGGSNVRSGEFVISYGNSFGYYGTDSSQLSTLARSDFDRTIKLIDSFNRREIRISLALQLAEAFN